MMIATRLMEHSKWGDAGCCPTAFESRIEHPGKCFLRVWFGNGLSACRAAASLTPQGGGTGIIEDLGQ